MRREEQVRVYSRRTAAGVQRNAWRSSPRTAGSELHSQRVRAKRLLHNEPNSLFTCEFSSA
jgi:CHAD domain-containing protein